MPVSHNTSSIVSGAQSIITPPIDEDDCIAYPTFQSLVAAECVPSRGLSLRYGRAWARRSPTEIAELCLMVPYCVAYIRTLRRLNGLRFFDQGPASLVEVHQGVDWAPVSIASWTPTSVTHDLPVLPAGTHARLTNRYGFLSNTVADPLPLINQLIPSTQSNYGQVQIDCTNNLAPTGKVWLTNSTMWTTSTIFLLQAIDGWEVGTIDFTITDVPPVYPTTWYCYIEDYLGARHVTGKPLIVTA